MADTQPFQPLEIYDAVSLFNLGMDSGSNPLLLKKNQLAFLSNGTVRGGFANSRTAFSKNHLTINYPSDAVRDAILEGLFQGAGYYQPDSGSQSLFAQIAGRLYQFQITGNVVDVFDRTVTSDPNPATVTQAWMWQSENYLIVNDGQSLPVFFDGATSRRSYGPSVLLAQVTAGPATPTAIGSQATFTLAAPWTGPFDVPVLFNGEYYQPIANTGGGYDVDALSLFDVAGTAINVGDPVFIKPSIAGVLGSPFPASGAFTPAGPFLTLVLTEPYQFAIPLNIILFGQVWRITSKGANNILIQPLGTGTYSPLPAGTQILFASSSAPNVLVGSVTVAAVAPAIGGTVRLTLDTLYSGVAGQVAYIGTQGQYKLTAVTPAPPGTSLEMINLTDESGSITYPLDILSVPELPPGRMGAYGLAQNWMCLVDGFSFICGDASRGPSGTAANNYRDAVLKTTDLTFRGGNFAVPGAGNVITAMVFTANLDESMGQGSLEVCTAAFMASCQAPIDFANPPTNGPILTFSLIGNGPLAQNSTIRVNSDVYFRSTIGLGSLILARRSFSEPGNTTISHEMERVLSLDNQTLLPYGSAVNFDNRKLDTCTPSATSQGVVHTGLVVTNYDSISSMQEKQPPVYDGLWTGLNVLQVVQGLFNGTERCFAFTFNVTLSRIELYEIYPTDSRLFFDDGSVPVTWSFETAALFNEDVKPLNVLARLTNGEFAVDDVIGRVNFQIYYKADQGCWTPWHSFSICSNTAGAPQYFPRLGLGEPTSANCDSILNTTTRDAYTFQFKWVITGRCRFLRARFQAVTLPTPKFPAPICNVGQ